MSTSSLPQRAVKSQCSPVNLLDTDIARIYTHLHPITLLSIYCLSFPLIVKDPTSALTSLLIPLAVLQITYVTLCLPPTGPPQSSGSKGSSSRSGGRKSGKKSDFVLSQRLVPALISLLLAVFLGAPLILGLLILFGAPVTTHIPHTVLLATHISLLSSLPLIYAHGVETSKWRSILSLDISIDEIFGAALGTCLGAWVGAVPIPLDWDREWQKWPVTIVTGGYIGWAVGKAVGGLILKGTVIALKS